MDTFQCMRIFAKVANDGGFSAAAKRLNVSTPAVSRAVSQLEAHLGSRLLNRSTRHVVLTEAGERYLRRCQVILASLDDAESEARSATAHPTGRLRVHALSSFGHQLVVPAILKYQQRFSELRVEVTMTGAIPDMLDGGYDASIVLAPELPSSAVVSLRLGRIRGVVCASPRYLANHGVPTVPEDLREHQCLQLTTSVFPFDKWVFKGADGTFPVDIGSSRLTVNAMEALELAVAGGLGIAILPAGVALPGLRSGALVSLLRGYEAQRVNVYALYPSRRFLDAKIRTFIDLLREEVPSMLEADARALAALDGCELTSSPGAGCRS
ncbi:MULTISPECIES: LysR family transcriptional regulator [Burkholderia]|uniref:LysR family transcriptional regulator n=1 Tax=Burkholderia contaminans TaxID=488447 RepID=A0A2S5E480_9BURK|nr:MULTISPECIES: LysR family transcriptional regulator [Burkholderia]EKS9795900.1 LysR family transcriptional regulator [Burkholderia cepacia]EKS9806680.1 LysR family transcriptional regulator [Burkholderia cepacia]EKS9814149.1 LysR family transcriptional regulator [Burkholderia cepacia]EKS9819224.1 LysR family transcriptional regulator [Burkholderia cepacia]EKS9827026.1 LysR family transcriptional regulator [Burkholderia cepacia]